jgi:hypothetical protein
MKQYFYLLIFSIIVFSSCGKDNSGIPEAEGGLLPTNYIYIKDGSFTPNNITAVNGSSFTFVNQSSGTQGIYSLDSIFINKQGIEANKSYFFKKDTVRSSPVTIYYFMAGKQNVNGSITITP